MSEISCTLERTARGRCGPGVVFDVRLNVPGVPAGKARNCVIAEARHLLAWPKPWGAYAVALLLWLLVA